MRLTSPRAGANRQGALAEHDGLVGVACQQTMVEQIGRDPPQPVLIVQGFGEGFGVLQVDEDALELAQRIERITQVEAQINGLRLRVAAPLGDVASASSACSKYVTASR